MAKQSSCLHSVHLAVLLLFLCIPAFSEPQPDWPNHAVVAFDSIRLESNSRVDGDIAVVYAGTADTFGAEEDVQVDSSVIIQGSITAEDVVIADRTRISGTIHAHEIAGRGATRISRGARPEFPLSISLPAIPWFDWSPRKIRVSSGVRSQLSPGTYGRIDLDGPDSVLELQSGIYNLFSLSIGERSKIHCAGSCEIRIFATLIAGAGSVMEAAEEMSLFIMGVDSRQDRTMSMAGAAVQLGRNSRIEGQLYAPNGTTWLDESAELKGTLIARAVFLGPRSHVSATSGKATDRAFPVTITDGSIYSFRIDAEMQIPINDLFTRYRSLFDLQPEDSMVPSGERRTSDGNTHSRYQQFYRSLPVFGADIVIQHANGQVISGIGRIVPSLNIDTAPRISEADAFQLAIKALGVKQFQEGSQHGMLGIGSVDAKMTPESFRLVYRFSIESIDPPGSQTVDVDANTGAIVVEANNIMKYSVNSKGDTLHYASKSFIADSFSDSGQTKYRLIAPDYVSAQPGVAPVGITTVRSLGFSQPNATPPTQGFILDNFVVDYFVDDDGDFRFWPLATKPNPDAPLGPLIIGVSAHWGLQQAVDYWKKAKWNGIDGVGAEQILAVINCPDEIETSSASYNFYRNRFCFGSGSEGLVHLGVIGHEFAHAIFDHVTQPFWKNPQIPGGLPSQGEMGVLNEGFGFIFGYLLDVHPDNWCASHRDPYPVFYQDDLGNGTCTGGTSLCPGETCDASSHICSFTVSAPAKCTDSDISNPKSTTAPDTYAGVNWVDPDCADPTFPCHTDATVLGHWFYILVNGKTGINDLGNNYTVPAIGKAKAEEVAIRTLTTKMWSSATFMGVRLASIQAAEDAFGKYSPEVVAVANAWYAVGVGEKFYTEAPETGVEPWPARLKWQQNEGEVDWEVQVSTSPDFDKDLKVLGAVQSEMVFDKVWLVASANLKPTTTYFWRVRARSGPAEQKSTEGKKKIPYQRSSRGFLNPTGGTMTTAPWIVSLLGGGWTAWNDQQNFTTAAKIPKPLSPAPATLPANYAGGILQASGSVYPWNAEFSWKPVFGAEQYKLLVSEKADMKCPPYQGGQQLTTAPKTSWIYLVPKPKASLLKIKYEVPLHSDRTYYWWLMVYGPEGIAGGCAYGGNPVQFKTTLPEGKLLSPSDGAKVSPFETTLTWDTVKGAAGYKVMVYATQTKGVFEQTTSTSKIFQAMKAATFYWKVQPKGPLSGDEGKISATWSFKTDFALTKPKLLRPINEMKVEFKDQTLFAWLPVASSTGYRLTVFKRAADGSAAEVTQQVDSGFYECTTDNQDATCIKLSDVAFDSYGYCWKVRAVGPGGVEGIDSDLGCYIPMASYPVIEEPAEGAQDVKYDPTTVSVKCPYCPGGMRFEMMTPNPNGLGCTTIDSKTFPNGIFQTTFDLQPDTDYCVGVWSLNKDGTNGRYRSANFHTKPKPAPACPGVKWGDIIVVSPATYSDQGFGMVPSSWNAYVTLINLNPNIQDVAASVKWTDYASKTEHIQYTGQTVLFSSLPKDPTYSGVGDARRYTLSPIAPGSDSTCFAADNYASCRIFYIQAKGKTANCQLTLAGGTGPLWFQW